MKRILLTIILVCFATASPQLAMAQPATASQSVATSATDTQTVGASTTATQQLLTFEEAVALMLHDNPAIAALESERKAAERTTQATIGLFLPQIRLRGAYIHANRDIALSLNNDLTAMLGLNLSYTLQPRTFGALGGDVVMPIFTGGRIIAARRAAKARKQSTEATISQSTNALYTELTTRYFGYALSLYVVKVREQVTATVARHLADLRQAMQYGAATRTALLYAEYRLAEAEREQASAELQLQTALTALRTTIGSGNAALQAHPEGGKSTCQAPLEGGKSTLGGDACDPRQSSEQAERQILPATAMFVIDELPPLEHLLSLAESQNPILQSIEGERALAGANVLAHRAEFFPEIVGMGAVTLCDHNLTPVLPRAAVGVGVSFTLFNGARRELSYSASRHTLRRVESLQQRASADIQTLVRQLYNQLCSYRMECQSLAEGVASAEAYLHSIRIALREGVATTAELLDAEVEVARMRIERVEAAYNFDTTLARLLEAVGESDTLPQLIHSTSSHSITYDTPPYETH